MNGVVHLPAAQFLARLAEVFQDFVAEKLDVTRHVHRHDEARKAFDESGKRIDDAAQIVILLGPFQPLLHDSEICGSRSGLQQYFGVGLRLMSTAFYRVTLAQRPASPASHRTEPKPCEWRPSRGILR